MYHNHHIHETKHLKEANLLQEEKYRHLTADPVGKLVCEMAVPTIISMLVTAVYNLADTFFVGLMHSNAATGAVGVVFSLMAIIQATGFFFGQGSGNYISRQLGRHETEDAETMAITAVTLAFSAGVVVLILGQLFLQPLARLLGSTDTILPYACDYLRIILLGAPYMTASFVLNNQLRFQGSAIYSMIGIVAGAVINVGLDSLLIFTFKMGIRGAALATIIGQLFSFGLLLFGCTRGGNLRLHPSKLHPPYFQGDPAGRLPQPVPPEPDGHLHHLSEHGLRPVRRRGHRRHERGEPCHDHGQLRADRLRSGLSAGLRLQLRRQAL